MQTCSRGLQPTQLLATRVPSDLREPRILASHGLNPVRVQCSILQPLVGSPSGTFHSEHMNLSPRGTEMLAMDLSAHFHLSAVLLSFWNSFVYICIYLYIEKMNCNDFVKLDSPMLRFDFMLNFGNSYTMIDVSIGILLLRIVW